MAIELIIKALHDSDGYIKSIFLQGGCYQFYVLMKSIYPTARPLINSKKDHVIASIEGEFFDITGKVSGEGFYELTNDDYLLVKNWSFSRSSALSLGECPHCEEPILI